METKTSRQELRIMLSVAKRMASIYRNDPKRVYLWGPQMTYIGKLEALIERSR